MKNNFRNYTIDENIKELYKNLRTNQTVDYVKNSLEKYCNFSRVITIWKALEKLNNFIDVSDPDINLPNIHHLFQTAEAIRKDGYPKWLQMTGLIHDLGKILYLKGCDEDGTTVKEQWGIVGDTFIVGCKIPDSVVFPEFNELNPDSQNPEYNTKYGIYKKNCGLDNTMCSFGHDEYLYQLLQYNRKEGLCNLPDEALTIIRYHSLYPWHKEGEYKHLMNEKDKKRLRLVKMFNKYDLYTKKDENIDLKSLKRYYDDLIGIFFPKRYICY